MNYKRNEKTNTRIATALCIIFLILFAISMVYIQEEREDLMRQNSEYLSVIEEYSVEHSKLEEKAKGYKNKIKNYKSQIKEYEEQIKEYKEKLETTTKPTTTKAVVTTTNATTKGTSSNSGSFTGNITAYCGCSKCCGKWATNNSVKYGASGMRLVSGYSVASDSYPMGTILYIEGYGKVQVADRFGAGHGKSRIDMYFDSHSTALQWGRQYRNVSVVS